MRDKPTPQERFWSHVDKSGDCWIWTGDRTYNGYGRFCVVQDGKKYMRRANRVAWEMENGREIPEGMIIMHTCDNPPCVNPDHLRLGTTLDNVADRVAKGRTYMGKKSNPARGEVNGTSKLTESAVREMRRLRSETGISIKAIGEKYGVSFSTSWRVISGTHWKHVN